jgi:hypothetical protein
MIAKVSKTTAIDTIVTVGKTKPAFVDNRVFLLRKRAFISQIIVFLSFVLMAYKNLRIIFLEILILALVG